MTDWASSGTKLSIRLLKTSKLCANFEISKFRTLKLFLEISTVKSESNANLYDDESINSEFFDSSSSSFKMLWESLEFSDGGYYGDLLDGLTPLTWLNDNWFPFEEFGLISFWTPCIS